MPNLWLDGFPVLLYRVCSHLSQGSRLQAEENLTNSLLRLLGKVQVQSNCRGTPGNLCGNIYSGDLNNEHLNNQLLLVRYSGVQYSNGSLVFRQPFGYLPIRQLPSKNQTSLVFRTPLYSRGYKCRMCMILEWSTTVWNSKGLLLECF